MSRWLLLVDMDRTLWSHSDISSLKPPFKPLNRQAIVDSQGVVVRLHTDILELVKWALEKNAIVSTLTWNEPDKVEAALNAFGIKHLFHFITAENTPRKDLMLEKLLNLLRRQGVEIPLDRIVYIDDRDIHIEDITRRIGGVHFLQYGVDFKTYEEGVKLIMERLGFR